MKKLVSLTMTILFLLSTFTACRSSLASSESETSSPISTETPVSEPTVTKATVRIGTLTGPTGMGMAKLMKDAKGGNATHNYEVEVFSGVEEIAPKMVKGEVDIFTVPANLAAVLSSKTEGNISVLAINTLGVLHILENGNTVNSVADLKDKTIYASGKGATPEYILNYILTSNGLIPGENVTVEYKSEQNEVVAALTATEGAIGMLPQPFATTAQMKDASLRTALDLTEQWDIIEADKNSKGTAITGVVIANTEFTEQNPEVIAAFMNDYEASISYVNTETEAAAEIIEEFNIFKAAVAKKAIPSCNIVYIYGKDMKEKLSGYLNVLFEQNPASVGGKLPSDSFYYNAE